MSRGTERSDTPPVGGRAACSEGGQERSAAKRPITPVCGEWVNDRPSALLIDRPFVRSSPSNRPPLLFLKKLRRAKRGRRRLSAENRVRRTHQGGSRTEVNASLFRNRLHRGHLRRLPRRPTQNSVERSSAAIYSISPGGRGTQARFSEPNTTHTSESRGEALQ